MGSGQEDHQDEERPDHVSAGVSVPRTPRHRKGDTARMVAVLAEGGTQQEAALAAGLSVREVRRRVREPDVQRLLRSARREHQRQMMAKVAEGGLAAVDTLRELLAPDQPVEVRFKAAKELLHAGTHNLESLAAREEFDEMQAQIDALEARDATEPGR